MRSLRSQLTWGLIAVFAVLTAAGGGFVYYATRAAVYGQFDEALRVKALVVVTATEQRRGQIEVEFSDRFLREFDDEIATDFFQVWTADGTTVERSDSLERRDLPQRFGTLEDPKYWNLDLPRDKPGRAIGIKFTPRVERDGDRPRGTPVEAVVVVAGNRRQIDATLNRLAGVLIGGGAGILLVTLLAVPLVLGPGLRPLRQVADQAAGIDAGNLAQRFPTAGLPAELAPICERLNALLARLESSFERERRFSADLAHELLTPLAELRALTESALKWPETSGPDTHRQALDGLLRMEALVTRLLDLSRAENGRFAAHPVTISLREFLEEAWRPFAVAAQEKNLVVKFEGPANATASADAAFLRAIVTNLFSNAVDYTPAGGFVRVAYDARAEGYALRVSNPAPQLSAGDVAQMFDRFWRKDPARTGGQHSGLGLALARELARVLGGEMEASLGADGTLTMALTVKAMPTKA